VEILDQKSRFLVAIPPKKLLGGEIGFGIPFVPVLGWEGGGVGPGKATGCYYWLSKSQYTDKDCECE
jgi:hypothetical protein